MRLWLYYTNDSLISCVKEMDKHSQLRLCLLNFIQIKRNCSVTQQINEVTATKLCVNLLELLW
jgi:hypothetical protein